MKKYKSRCFGCGTPVVFECMEPADLFIRSLSEDELGWWDHECTNCGWYTPCESIEYRASKDLKAFCCCLETPESVEVFAKVLYEEHPELFEKEDLDE